MGQRIMDIGTNFILRGCMGMGMIYFINTYLEQHNIMAEVGMNGATAFVTSALGIPGVGLLYGITFFQML